MVVYTSMFFARIFTNFSTLIRDSGSIQRKLFFSYLVVLLSVVLITGVLTVTVLQNILQNEMLDLKQRSVAQMNDKFQLIVDHVLAVSNIYYISPNITQSLTRESEPGSYEWYHEQAAFTELFYQYDFAFDWLNYSTSVIGYNGKQFHSFPSESADPLSDPILPLIRQQEWYKKLLQREGQVLWLSELGIESMMDPSFHKTFYAVRELHSMYTGKSIGLLFIGLDIRSFDSRLYQGSVQNDEIAYLLDSNYTIVSSSSPDITSKKLPSELQKQLTQDKAGNEAVSLDGEKYQAIWYPTPIENWLILSVVKKRNLFHIIYLSRRFLLLILLFCYFTASLVAYLMASHFSRPIQTLAMDMKKVEAGDLYTYSRVNSNDEIGNLSNRFNSMVKNMRELLSRNLYINEMKQKAELEALQHQINPHFIYNSLGTIRFMLRLEPIEKTENAIVALNKMLRYTLSGPDYLVLLSQEIEMTQNYIAIAEKQLKNSLQLKYEVPEDVLTLYIPKLIIQPLVENAIFHGIKPARKKGFIKISATKQNQDLQIEISDNGIGFSFDSIEHLREKQQNNTIDSNHNGVGLLNIHDRIVLRFGSAYGVLVHQQDGGLISIKLPVLSTNIEGADNAPITSR